MTTTYTTRGSVRGSCGHKHRTIRAAYACAARDGRACGSLGGGAYSDRVVVRTDGEELDRYERRELDAADDYARDHG